ncbi:MAG: 1-phosphofructokinase [Clostridiales bacterium]|nr:1-phosphofructokinase [Clostridiales bacterium]
MIYTVTLNPSIDYTIQLESLKVGGLNKVIEDFKFPGGKGINVSRVLNNLGVKSKALGFIGGFTGKYLAEFLEKEGLETDFIKVAGDTRINVKIKAQQETELNAAGPEISDKALGELMEKINTLPADTFVVLAGNIPRSLPQNTYAQIIKATKNEKDFIVDAVGQALLETLQHKPFLIKPNKEELEDLFKVKIDNLKEIVFWSRKLLALGAKNVIVSLGKKGAVLINNDIQYYASAPVGKAINTVGAGDSLIAGFLSKYIKSRNILDSFRYGVAAGSATAFSMDLCKKAAVDKLFSEVKLMEI